MVRKKGKRIIRKYEIRKEYYVFHTENGIEKLYNIRQVSIKLGISFWKLAYLVRKNKIPPPKYYNSKLHRLYTEEDIVIIKQIIEKLSEKRASNKTYVTEIKCLP